MKSFSKMIRIYYLPPQTVWKELRVYLDRKIWSGGKAMRCCCKTCKFSNSRSIYLKQCIIIFELVVDKISLVDKKIYEE